MVGHGYCEGYRDEVPGTVYDEKKTDVKQKTEWRNLFASIVSNTSMTMKDIADLRINEFEELLEGMNENAEEMKRELNGDKPVLEGDSAIEALLGR